MPSDNTVSTNSSNMTDEIEKLRLELEAKRIDNDYTVKIEELRLREKEFDAAQARANFEAGGITAPRATLYAAVATLIGGILGAVINGTFSRETNLAVELEKRVAAIELEKTKFETGLILKAIEAHEQSEAVKALQFFANAGLIPTYEKKVMDLASKDEGALIPSLGPDSVVRPAVRWPVKTGTDGDAKFVAPISEAIQITVEDLVKLPRPSDMLPASSNFPNYENKRARPVETNVYSVEASISAVKFEVNGDLHLVLRGESGQTMIAVAPRPEAPFVLASSRWKKEMTEVRDQLDGRLVFFRGGPAIRVRVVGVGFFNRVAGQIGVAITNGIELHPILGISFIE